MRVIRKGILLSLLSALVCFLLVKRTLTVTNSISLIKEFYCVNSDVAFCEKATSFSSRIFVFEEIRDPYFLMSPLLLSYDKATCESFEVYYDSNEGEVFVVSEWKSSLGKSYEALDKWTLREYLIINKECEYCIERR